MQLSTDLLNITAALIPGLPLTGFLGYLIYGKFLSEKLTGILASTWIMVAFGLSAYIFTTISTDSQAITVHFFDWIHIENFKVPFSFQIDQLSVIMMMLITGVGSLIHIYSIGYMHGDEGYGRFFAYLNLFIFFMLILIMANNYVLMFAGWEGVGLCSYLLIGFWHKHDDFNGAANKAFIINRIGDIFLLFGLFLIFKHFGSFEYEKIESSLSSMHIAPVVITMITLLLFIGATGKSAQIPLFTWLPDAMAGPTPVSALIHAATMVTAGVYLIIRSDFIYILSSMTNDVIMIIGMMTAILAGLIALKQNDIKKVLAYSTVSQLGLMFFALGIGAYGAAFFHLLTHAFFKALLFLGAGSVIHGLQGEQDIRRMGDVKKYMSNTHIIFLIGVLAIIAVPPFAGFYSKDYILTLAYIKSPILWAIALCAGLLTVFYMLRLYFVVFRGKARMTAHLTGHIHESPWVMMLPLYVLAALSIVGGYMNVPEILHGNKILEHYIAPVTAFNTLHLNHNTEWILMSVSILCILLVSYFAYRKYIAQAAIPEEDDKLTLSGTGHLFNKKFFVDEIYASIFTKPLLTISSVISTFFEKQIIQRIADRTGQITLFVSSVVRKSQNGYISYYLFAMALGVLGILTIFIFFAL